MTCGCNNNFSNSSSLNNLCCSDTSQTPQNHAQYITVYQFVACVKIGNNWVVPAGDASVSLVVPALVDVMIGSCIWNPDYGTFRILEFDAVKKRIKVVPLEDAADAGTSIITGTQFMFVKDPG